MTGKLSKRLIIPAAVIAVALAGAVAAYVANRPFEGPYSLLAPREKLERFLNGGDVVLNMAHAGMSRFAPKNSIPAFRSAFRLGCDGVEMDVVRCKTGEVIVHHDFTLEKSVGLKKHVLEVPLEEFRTFKLKPRKLMQMLSGARVPTLEEVLTLFGDRMIIFVEVKNEGGESYGAEMEVARLIMKYGLVDTCLVSSFDPEVIANLAHNHPEAHAVLELYDLPDGYMSMYPEPSYPYTISLRKDCVTPEFVRWAAEKFRGVSTFTPNERDELERLVRYGVTLFQTNRPQTLAKILNKRNK